MMEWILQQQQLLCATLIEICQSDLMPTDAEISNMEGFVEAMRQFAEITEVMGKEKQVSFSAVRLFRYKLLSIHLIENLSDSGVMKQIKQVVKSDLEDCYSDPHLMMLLNKACFLDPRLKSLSFLSDEDRKSVLLSVEEEAVHIKTEMISSKGGTQQMGRNLVRRRLNKRVNFYCYWKMSWIRLIQHMQILVLKKLQTKKYRNTFVSMLTKRKILLGGGKFTVHSYLN